MVTDSTSQADDTTAFLRAARSGNLEKVIEFLDTDLDINTANSNGLNALHLASKDGHVEIVTELLKRGAKVDAATKKGNTALHIASLAGQVEIVNILIQYGAAVNIQSQNGFTPLYMAAQENHDQVVKLLLGNGANQSLATEDGFTPLAVAMQQGHDKVVSVLLENDSKGKVRLPALHIAAKKDDCKAADLLLQNDHKPDVTSKSGFTPLHIAAHYGNEEIARLLIKRGADVNYLAKHNISPLHVAAKWGKNNMVKVLLENSAQIDAKTRDGLTPLHCAARSGHEQVITTLLEHSAPISARTKNGLAPLHMASQGDHVDAARVLLYHRAPVDEVTIDYLTSLHVAAHCGHVRVAKLLLDRKADPNARALNGFTPLHIACKKNRIKVVELLLKHGASIESTTESGLTPLHVASFMGCMNIVIFLLQHEANPDVPTVRGETPLHLAARANQTDIIRILLRNGAKVDARAREQQTPLHIASRLRNIDIVMLLLQHGAAVDTTTKDMYTALHIAAKEGQEEVATILVENNASLKATTKNGFTPLHIAAKYGNMSVAKILLQRDSKLDAQGKNDISPLHLACHYDHPNVANLLLEKGASPHLASQNGHTPLHIAARKNQMDIASTLLENGANANAESKAGFTPLHLSAQKGHYDMTNLLIEHGADPNHKSKNGLTALHLCAQEDFIKVASILVKNGANVESETETGYRPIHVAAHFGNLSMIRFLLKHSATIDVKSNQNYTALHQAAQQGHAHIVSALLEGNASHKARTNDGLTALNIAQKLGYISVMEVLKGLSYDTLAPDNKNWDEKYKVIAPESLQETSFMSDSEDEGGSDALISEQPYRYLTADLMKSLRDDSLPIDVTRDDPIHRQVTKEEKQDFTQSNNYCLAENFDTDGFNLGRLHFRSFLVSFLVDARGGAMKGCRHSGVRIIVPPRRATMPIRVTCRLIKPTKIANPPPLMEGEALATRIMEMGPVGATFLGPVLIDIPHFASIRGKEREIIILRSENGETWKEHDNSVDNDTTLLNTPYDPQMSATHSGRITRIITTDFPQYFAIITRIKQEVHVIGAEGGILTSSVANDVQAVFPPGALTKKIKVGLQAHVIPAELTAKLLGNCVAVSPVITIEPRRRKFHKPITLTIPVPQAANKGMINQYGGETPTLRLLCSIAGGTSESQWEDVTGSTPLTFMNDTVSFTTTVSARFWLMDCRNIGAVPKMATELYEESLFVPYITNFVIYSKRMDVLEATLRILCMTDGKEGLHTLERQEEFVEIVKSRDVEALDGKDLYIEFSGNLVPVTKSGVQLKFTFKAFRQNRLSFHVKVKDPLLDPVARMLFMREPKVAKGEPPQQPICVLNIVLPEITTKVEVQKKLKDYEDSNIIEQKLDSYESKYKMEQKEKGDEPKDTSPSEQKFITDTLQKERTDAVTIHEFLAQKAACSLESVDASYPSKVVGQEQDLSPSVERQTYSEKRKFWEDISRKRESYQRSESEMSRTSQLTINESDSEYIHNITTEDTADIVQQMDKSETLEDLNVPDISECSVAEKAQYFEEQIQKETTKIPPKLLQQDSLKSDKEKLTKTKMSDKEKLDKDEKYVTELKQVTKTEERREIVTLEREERKEVERKETKETMKLSSEDEKEKDESKPTYVDVSAKIELAKAKLDETTEKGERKEDVEKTDAVLSMQPLEIKDKHVERKEHVEKEAEPSMPTEEKSLDTTQKTEESGAMVEDQLVELKVERVTKQEDRAIVIAEVPVQDIVKDVKVEREDTKRSIMELSAKETKDVEERHKDVAESVEASMPQESIKERVEVKEKVEEPRLELTTKEEDIRERVETSTEGERMKESIEEERKEKREIVSEVILQESVDQSLKRQKREEQEDTIAEVTVKEDDTKEKEEYKEEAIEEQEEAIAKVAAEKESTKEKMEYKEEAVEEEEVAEVTAKEESTKEKKEDKQEATKKVSVEIGGEEKEKDIEKKETEEEKITDAREKEEELQVITEAPVERKLQREVITERETKREEAQDEVVEHVEKQEKESEKVVTDVIVRERVRTPEIKEEDVVREKSTGRRIITEETTIIYKVQKDGTLVQEQVLKSVQVEGGSEALAAALVQLPESKIETKSVYEVESTSEVTPEITFTSDIRKEMQKLLEGERATEIEVKDKTKKEITSIEEEKSEKASPVAISSIQEVEDGEIKGKREESRKEEKEEITLDKKTVTEMETKHVRKEFESRIPVSTAKIDKDKMQKETKPKSITELKQIPSKLESDKELSTEEQEISPTTKKKEFESRIPKRVIDIKPTSDKAGKKDTHVRKESESYTITEKKSSEEVTSKLEEHLTTKSETQTFSKSFVDPQEAFKMFEDMESAKSEFATVTSKIDHKTSTTTEKKEVVSSEISNGRDKVITLEEKERVERKKSSESRLKKESPTETLEEKKSKHEELDKTAIQKLSMNLTDTQEIIDAAASESRTETKKEETLKKLSDKEGVMTREAGSSLLRESDADVAIRIKKDIGGKRDDEKDEVKTVEGKPATERISKPVADSDHIETLAQGESRKESKESFDVIQFVPSERRKTEEEDLSKKEEEASEAMEEEVTTPGESLEEKQRLKFKEIEARTIAETLIQSIEREIEAKSAEDLKAELLGKGYLEQIISESVETDHEKLADDLTRKFESIMRKTMDKQAAQMKIDESLMESPRLRSSIQEESLDKSSTRDSISVSEDITKDEESSPQEKEESFPLSSSQAKLQDRDITMSPSSISEQIDFEETIDVDTNELESVSKPTSSAQSEKQRFSKSSSQVELQRDFQSDVSLPRDKIVSEISGARVLEILEPGVDSQSREDSVDVPSLEMDEHKISEQTSRGIPSLHESAEMDSFDKMDQERDITISPSTVSEDTNIDYSLVQESSQPIPMQKDLPTISTRRADSFEIESPPLVSPKPKVRGLEIKPVDWMIGDEKIEISETLQPSQIFNQELEAYESMKKKERLSSLDGSTDHEQESGTKSSEEISVIESTKETVADNGRDKSTASSVGETKLTAIPVSEQDFESELVENKLDVSCQELVDTLQREYDAKTPIKEYIESIQREISSERIAEAMEEREVLQADESASQERPEVLPATTTEKSLEEETREETMKEDASSVSETSKREEILSKSGIELKLEKTTTRSLKESEKPAEEVWQETTDSEKPVRVDDVLKEWTEAYLSKMKPLGDDYKRHMEKATEKHDKPGRSTTVPSDTCAFKIKKDDLPSVDLSARYAITVLDQVVKKEIAEVKESLEAAKQDLIEELSENSETVIQIKDSPSEFRFKLQPESIPNDLPFLYTPSFPEQQPHESDTEAVKSESPIDKSMPYETKDSTESKMELEESTSSSIEEPVRLRGDTPVIKTEKSDVETAAITVHEDTKDDEEEHPSPVPASRSGSDIDNKDESSSLALPRPVLRRRQKPGRSSKRVASDSDADLGSSSGESSNYQSCDYEIGSGSRPSSSDVEALQSCGVPSATASEYETAMMSIEHSSSSKPTSQEYHTAATTMSSRESMKSLTSLSSGHLGSIDSTSELSETLVPSETDAEKEEVEERLDGALEEEHTEQSDSSGSDIPIDEPIDNIYSSIPCRMKRSSEMIFPQVLDNAALEVESTEELTTKDAKGIDFATSTLTAIPGTLRSVDIMTSRVSEHGVQSVCTQVISTQTTSETESSFEKVESETFDAATAEKDTEEVTLDVPTTTESELLEQRYVAAGVSSESPEMSMQTSTPSIIQQTSMSTSSTSGVSIDTVVGKEKSDRHSPDSDSFEMVDKPDIIDDFVVIEEVGKEAEEYDSEGKSIRISSIPQASSKQYDRDLENLITENKQDSQVSTSQTSKNNELFDFESEESPPQVSNDDQYSQSYSDEEQYEGGKKWIEMQFHADPRVYDIEYDRGPLEDIKEEEITDFEAGSSRFGSLGSHKESIGSVGSMRGSFGSTPDYDVLTGKKYFTRPSDHDNVSLSSLQEFENLESAVAAENSRRLQCGSHDSVNNGSLPRRYMTSRSGHGDDISLSSLKDFEGLEKACREAHLIELRAREEEDLLEHESPENKYKLESLPRTRIDTSTAGSFNASTSGSDDYEKRIKEIDEIIRIAQSNVEKFDRQDDTTEDISQIEITDVEKIGTQVGVQSISKPEEPETVLPLQRESNVMETSTDSLELEDNMDKKHHPLCRSSDSLEMKTTLDFPSLSSDSLNNVRDAKEMQSDVAEHASSVRRISSDSLDMPLLEPQDAESRERPSNEDDHSDGVTSDNSLEQRSETVDTDKSDKMRTTPSTNT
ncbi:ankyrin-2 isoform X2 [Bombus impatiens]|uniref:Ankyrin-2 isoform X2 n=1 Tax=Bombus impatiens TaxID=132113 RepID=A0A6P3V747_BOMIM|nr:ankyrin-2 isoform X2 [Bombus impatiens]